MKRLTSLDGLRGLLAVYVLLGHMAPFASLPAWIQTAVSHGGAAVDVFFMLSGLVITQSMCSAGGLARPFLIARTVRIFPVFLAAFALAVALEPASCGFEHMPWVSPTDTAHAICGSYWPDTWLPEIAAHLTMMHGLFPYAVLPHVWVSFLGSAWSLSTEWQFYILALLVGIRRGRLPRQSGECRTQGSLAVSSPGRAPPPGTACAAASKVPGGRAKPHRYQVKPLGGDDLPIRHGRAWPGHPGLPVRLPAKSWVAGPSPAMTEIGKPRPRHKPSPPIAYPGANGARPGHDTGGSDRLCRILLALALAGLVWQWAGPDDWQFSRAFLPNKGHFFALGVASVAVVRSEPGAIRRYALMLVATLAVCAAGGSAGKLLPPLLWTVCLWVQMHPACPPARFLSSRSMGYAGAISYSLYLINEPIHKMLGPPLGWLAGGDPALFTLLWLPAAIGLPIVAAAMLHRYLEIPAQRWGRACAYSSVTDKHSPAVQGLRRGL